jgi:hypothetical protein
VFYGAFEGRTRIATMIDDWFYRTARDFRWHFHQPVSDGTTLYARYTFSYVSTLPEARGKRVGFEGVAVMQLRDGLITEYREVANVGPAFVALGFAPERVCKLLARAGEHLSCDPSFARQLACTDRCIPALDGLTVTSLVDRPRPIAPRGRLPPEFG